MRRSRVLLAVLAALALWVGGARADGVVLRSAPWQAAISPGSLAVVAGPVGKASLTVSSPQEGLGPVEGLTTSETQASWRLPQQACSVAMYLEGETLTVRFRGEAGRSVTWPALGSDPAAKAYLLPLFEGSYVPLDNAEWQQHLVREGEMKVTEGLSMPFVGVEAPGYTLTYLLANPFHTTLSFAAQEGRTTARVTHAFSPQEPPGDYTVVVRLGGDSPVEPARQYRQWLLAQHDFVTLREKIAQVPEAEKLLGAAHVYLWGNALLSRHDVLDWHRFVGRLFLQASLKQASPARRVWELLNAEERAAVQQAAGPEFSRRLVPQLAETLNDLLSRRDLYQAEAWKGIALPEEARTLLRGDPAKRSTADVLRLNGLLLAAAFPAEVLPSATWGDGVSTKMVDRLHEAGFDRLWLGLDSWQGGYRHPQAIARAKQLGYLIGTYDSYESIHAPGEPDTWETAQFDVKLYATGAVVGRDGHALRGFQGKGYRLSPLAAKPYVEARVKGLFATLPVPFNSWFIDCDAYGDLEDDYHSLHRATQRDDMQARLDRMRWIRDTYHLVIGSERGAAYAASTLHFAHGMTTPVFGWGDAELQKDKQSPYYLGAWYPPDGPQIMVKQVPLKPSYLTPYFDPRYRLPLYETVFHDSLVTTHHWQYASLKFSDQVVTDELLELLYNVPPLYNLNLDEWEKHRARIQAHYRFFSPLHKELGLLPMTDFAWLTPDRLVQKTVFGGKVELVANFGGTDFTYQGTLVPGRSVLARWIESGKVEVYTPGRGLPT